MWKDLLRAGGYAFAIREIAGYLGDSRKEKELKRSQYLNMVVGITLGTAVGVTTGMLLAPRSGRETRDKIANQTHAIMERVKESAHHAKKDVEQSPQFQSAVQAAEETKEVMEEEAERRL